ncbi:MAG: MqnA/MqnD/SBP family protein [Planctomycetota bacterium]|nr:MqnA/MqnD/SBP family protein [Planctomycetota bacterium]
MHTLTLAHSPDPDDAFMWWPLTGKVDAQRPSRVVEPARLDTGRFRFVAVPADIEKLNRAAIRASTGASGEPGTGTTEPGSASGAMPTDVPEGGYDITALSFRAAIAARGWYRLTRCGSSFGDGYGPKVVARPALLPALGRELQLSLADAEVHCQNCLRDPEVVIAVPGFNTTAFLLLSLALGPKARATPNKFVETPFEQVIPAVARGWWNTGEPGTTAGVRPVHAGLVIHEAQVTFERAGLRLVLDTGAWWKQKTGLPLPLGANAVRRDLDERCGAGATAEVAALLRRSIEYALAHREEALEYTRPFALANVERSGHAEEAPTLERIDRYVGMYVNRWTLDLGDDGLAALQRLCEEGAAAGLMPPVEALDPV